MLLRKYAYFVIKPGKMKSSDEELRTLPEFQALDGSGDIIFSQGIKN